MAPEGVAAPARKPSRDETLVKALVQAHRWRRKIESGNAPTGIELFGREAHRYQVLAATTMISDALVEYPRSCGSGTSQASRPAYLFIDSE
jgi:hypothetical protein